MTLGDAVRKIRAHYENARASRRNLAMVAVAGLAHGVKRAPRRHADFARGYRAKLVGYTTIAWYHVSPGARWVEFGRGKDERLPPPELLEAWAAKKGISFPGVGFVLARAIAKKGWKGAGILKHITVGARRKLRELMRNGKRKS